MFVQVVYYYYYYYYYYLGSMVEEEWDSKTMPVFANICEEKIRALKTWCYTGLGTYKSDLCLQ